MTYDPESNQPQQHGIFEELGLSNRAAAMLSGIALGLGVGGAVTLAEASPESISSNSTGAGVIEGSEQIVLLPAQVLKNPGSFMPHCKSHGKNLKIEVTEFTVQRGLRKTNSEYVEARSLHIDNANKRGDITASISIPKAHLKRAVKLHLVPCGDTQIAVLGYSVARPTTNANQTEKVANQQFLKITTGKGKNKKVLWKEQRPVVVIPKRPIDGTTPPITTTQSTSTDIR